MKICPRCSVSLATHPYEGVQIDACPRCAGEWLDSGELKRIVDARERQWEPKDREAMSRATIKHVPLRAVRENLSCPVCRDLMEPVNYGGDSGIIIDKCRRCDGIWA